MRRVKGASRGTSLEGNVDKWELLNAVDTRKEYVAALRVEHKKTFDSLAATYPNELVSQFDIGGRYQRVGVRRGGKKQRAGGENDTALLRLYVLVFAGGR